MVEAHETLGPSPIPGDSAVLASEIDWKQLQQMFNQVRMCFFLRGWNR